MPNPLSLWLILLSSISTFMLPSTSKFFFNYVWYYRNALRLIATRIFSSSIFRCELWLNYQLNCNRQFGFPNLDNRWFWNHNQTAPNCGNTTAGTGMVTRFGHRTKPQPVPAILRVFTGWFYSKGELLFLTFYIGLTPTTSSEIISTLSYNYYPSVNQFFAKEL